MKKHSIIWQYMFRYKYRYLLGLLTLLLVDYLNLFIPQITGEITDGLAAMSIDMSGIIKCLFYLIAVAVGLSIGRIFWRYFIFGTSRMIENDIRLDLFAKLETLSANYFNRHKTGDLMANFTNDLEALRNAVGPAIISAFDAVVMTVMVLYRMIVYVDWRLTAMTLVPMSIIAIGGYYFSEIYEKRFTKKQNAFALLSDFVQESISGARVIKAFVQEKAQNKSFKKINDHNKAMNMNVVTLMAIVNPLLDVMIGISYILTIIYGGYLAITAQITLGRFVAFSQYIGMLVWPMIALGDAIISFSQGRAAIERLTQVFGEEPEIKDDPQVLDVPKLNGDIVYDHLSFAYSKDLPLALHDVSFHLRPGETLAILGKTGAGKSTLVNLLLRVYDEEGSHITIDGHPLKKLPLQTIRREISYVPQDSYLFSDTISNNIAFGKPDATQYEIEQVAKIACVHDDIADFPMKYETVVGERGVTLSGGQKQRCALARALLKAAPILIMDDSLSAVDTDTEDQIIKNLKDRKQTVIMIAHRISTVRFADHIMVLEEGKPVQYGSFQELLADEDGAFYALYTRQQLEAKLEG